MCTTCTAPLRPPLQPLQPGLRLAATAAPWPPAGRPCRRGWAAVRTQPPAGCQTAPASGAARTSAAPSWTCAATWTCCAHKEGAAASGQRRAHTNSAAAQASARAGSLHAPVAAGCLLARRDAARLRLKQGWHRRGGGRGSHSGPTSERQLAAVTVGRNVSESGRVLRVHELQGRTVVGRLERGGTARRGGQLCANDKSEQHHAGGDHAPAAAALLSGALTPAWRTAPAAGAAAATGAARPGRRAGCG